MVPTETLGIGTIQSSTAGTLMKKNDALWFTNTGTDIYGFSALPRGARRNSGYFFNFNFKSNFLKYLNG